MTWSLVYLRPDGWWSAGGGWTTINGAYRDGERHDWGRSLWAVMPTSALVDDDDGESLRLPPGGEPPAHAIRNARATEGACSTCGGTRYVAVAADESATGSYEDMCPTCNGIPDPAPRTKRGGE